MGFQDRRANGLAGHQHNPRHALLLAGLTSSDSGSGNGNKAAPARQEVSRTACEPLQPKMPDGRRPHPILIAKQNSRHGCGSELGMIYPIKCFMFLNFPLHRLAGIQPEPFRPFGE